MSRDKVRGRVWKSSTDSLWYFDIVAANGEIVSKPEGHQNRGDAVDVAWEVVGTDGTVQILGKPGQPE